MPKRAAIFFMKKALRVTAIVQLRSCNILNLTGTPYACDARLYPRSFTWRSNIVCAKNGVDWLACYVCPPASIPLPVPGALERSLATRGKASSGNQHPHKHTAGMRPASEAEQEHLERPTTAVPAIAGNTTRPSEGRGFESFRVQAGRSVGKWPRRASPARHGRQTAAIAAAAASPNATRRVAATNWIGAKERARNRSN